MASRQGHGKVNIGQLSQTVLDISHETPLVYWGNAVLPAVFPREAVKKTLVSCRSISHCLCSWSANILYLRRLHKTLEQVLVTSTFHTTHGFRDTQQRGYDELKPTARELPNEKSTPDQISYGSCCSLVGDTIFLIPKPDRLSSERATLHGKGRGVANAHESYVRMMMGADPESSRAVPRSN